MTPIFLLGLAIGSFGTRRVSWNLDSAALVAAAAPLGLAIRIHLWWAGVTCPRYFFPVAMLLLPYAAMGLLRACGLGGQARPLNDSGNGSMVRTALVATAVAAVGLTVSLGSDLRFRRRPANWATGPARRLALRA